jgi:hypothetical protein
MIDEHDESFDSKITLHDRHRFEIKLDMDLSHGPRPTYELESYFFVPRALNISPQTYTKEDFYNTTQRYIRFKTPGISLSKLCDPGLSTSPLTRVKEDLSGILSGSRAPGLVGRVYDEFKLLGCVIRGEIRDHSRDFLADLAASEARPDGGRTVCSGEGFADFLADLKRIIDRIHALKSEVMDPAVPVRLKETFKFLDEYLSLIIEEYLTPALAALRANKAFPAGFKKIEEDLSGLVLSQGRHRAAMGYPSIFKKGESNEVLIYRRGVLKKFISSVLYLKTEMDEWQAPTQMVSGLAAGLAMLFAVLAAIYAQSRYTMNSAPFVMVIVISYVFKDRIKDWLKLLFSRNLTRWFSDREIKILDPVGSKKIGVLKEAFTFIPENSVPPDIARLRSVDNITSVDEDGKPERVFKYKKEIRLYPDKILGAHSRRRDLNDIMRFNIKDFITQADDSRVDYQYADPDTGAILTAPCSRVYHVNMIIKYSYSGAQGAAKIHYDRIRIVLDKNGLARLEEVRVS